MLLHLQHIQEQPFIYLLENVPSLNDSRPQVLVAWQQVHVWLGKPILMHVALRRTSLGGTIRNITFWFSWTHWTLKYHRTHLNKYFHFLMSNLLGSINFEFSIISIIIWCVLMFLIIAFRKSFMNVTLIHFLELFGHEYKFETWFENFLGVFLKS
jgi:hypothetical protein